ncbi:hypothetical protein ACLBWX_21150 [Methylobacterium sp. M6A4_1b]
MSPSLTVCGFDADDTSAVKRFAGVNCSRNAAGLRRYRKWQQNGLDDPWWSKTGSEKSLWTASAVPPGTGAGRAEPVRATGPILTKM